MMPVDWVSEYMVTLYKGKGDKCECTSFMSKVYGECYEHRLHAELSEMLVLHIVITILNIYMYSV